VNTVPRLRRSPLRFFLLVFALSLPFFFAGAFTTFQLLPGIPVTALIAVFCPATAAVILVCLESRTAGVRELLKRSFDFKRIRAKTWYAPIVLLAPGFAVLQYGLIRWMGVPLPVPRIPVVATLGMSLAMFVAALGEELGWSGYVIDPMQDRWGALPASILLGLVWAIWHFVPLVQVHRSPVWIAWWCLGTVAARVLIVWLYNNTGKSVFAAAVLHTMMNVSWQLFPIHGSYFDQRVNGVITALAAAVVVVVWGPRTLARYKNG
jgi:CAAX protease family protein